jgi:Predicted membrane protein
METEGTNNSQSAQVEPQVLETVHEKSEKSSIAIIAYLTLIGLVVAFVMNNEKKEPFARYHIRQSLGLNIAALALSMVNVIPILGWIVSIIGMFVVLYMWVVGLMNAINGKEKPLPILGKQFEEWFKSV